MGNSAPPITDAAVFAVILAAGESSRMGSPKALLPLGGQSALERCARLFLDAGISDIRVVTGACNAEALRKSLPQLPVTWVHNEAYHRGMFSSICRGISIPGPDRSGFFLLPVDIPLVRQHTVITLLEAWRSANGAGKILHPVFRGHRGHPPLIPATQIPGILSWRGEGGLHGYLETLGALSTEVEVFDRFILRDMDTPAGYQALSREVSQYSLPSREECEALLSAGRFFQPHTAAHCRSVAALSAFLSTRLVDAGLESLDIHRITAAALLHDIAKGQPGHAQAGALLLNRLGFSGISSIVASHVDIQVSDTPPPTDAQIVYLADKLVRGTALVTLSERFDHKIMKYGDNPGAMSAIRKRLKDAEAIVKKIESTTGSSMDLLLQDFLRRRTE